MIDIRIGDCLELMPIFPENSVDSIITDPPYGLDFMGKEWDHGVPGVEFWQAALRVAKPGAILMAFGGTRTFHRLACAIEDAGWELRDTACWLYGSGFPKSLDISKAIDRAAGAEREAIGVAGKSGSTRHCMNGDFAGGEYMDTAPATSAAKLWSGYGTALKPAWEPIIVAMKPLDGTFAENAQKWGVAGLNIDGGRIATDEVLQVGSNKHDSGAVNFGMKDNRPMLSNHSRSAAAAISKGKYGDSCEQETHQTAGQAIGRWPANLLLDGDSARSLDEQSGDITTKRIEKPSDCATDGTTSFDHMRGSRPARGYDGNGGASRFFYTAKASSSERNAGLEDCEPQRDADRVCDDGVGGDNPRNRSNTPKKNFHPTVKPVDLMRYLCKLTRTPTGGVVLDPFMGSGTTGIACILEHRDFIGIELNAEYAEIAKKRIVDMEGPLFSS